jgi:hypothetical protein
MFLGLLDPDPEKRRNTISGMVPVLLGIVTRLPSYSTVPKVPEPIVCIERCNVIHDILYFQVCDFLHQGREKHCRRSCR